MPQSHSVLVEGWQEGRTIRLVAMMSVYDEQPERIRQCVRDVHKLGVTHAILVDGAYALYPGGEPTSSPAMHKAFTDQARWEGIDAVVHAPNEVWAGNEVEKRQAMLTIAQEITNEGDWLMPWDGDFHLHVQQDVRGLLERDGDGWDFADIQLTDSPYDDGWYWIRLFLRARRDLRFGANHYTYLFGERDQLRWRDGTERRSTVVGPRAEDLEYGLKTEAKIKHRPEDRAPGRRGKQVTYYMKRDYLGIER